MAKKTASDLSVAANIRLAYAYGVAEVKVFGKAIPVPYFLYPIALAWALIGAIAPIGSHLIAAHFHPLNNYATVQDAWAGKIYADPMFYLWSFALVGFLTFSATTVYEWLEKGYNSKRKALGIVVGTETVMVFAYHYGLLGMATSYTVLFLLSAINMTAVACQAVLDDGIKYANPRRAVRQTTAGKSRAKKGSAPKVVDAEAVASNTNGKAKAA